jgi:uncharacterized protein YdeI (YjbR/CyaY-like superfamily)
VKRPSRNDVTIFRSAAAFRSWLEKHHATADAVWVGYYRKGTRKVSITYPESVDQALCYGWIDGIAYRIDDELHTNRFTPRRKGSYWSAVNIGKVQELQAAGLMSEAGLRAFEMRSQSAARRYSYENRPADLPEVLSAIPEGMRLLPGRLNEDHSCDRGNGEDIEGCDCEVDTFSRPECDGCGDWHHGERHAFIGWTEVPA